MLQELKEILDLKVISNLPSRKMEDTWFLLSVGQEISSTWRTTQMGTVEPGKVLPDLKANGNLTLTTMKVKSAIILVLRNGQTTTLTCKTIQKEMYAVGIQTQDLKAIGSWRKFKRSNTENKEFKI